ncbi:hypothetical protein [Minwuia sp. IMCC3009]|uniref:hypothetical protein n=1 Tax=Minwuia sp. IMCC3009 TaxID=3040674 RepID=UPI00247905A8|nr:hypothetical protein [Minwuia sp. IMCC3009]
MFKLLHAGFDTIDLAIQGSLPPKILDQLRAARDEAATQQEPALCHLSDGKFAAHVSSHGAKGGYAFLLSTGPTGANWMIKDSSDPNQWNIFVSPRSTMLLTNGYAETFTTIEQTIADLGGKVIGVSLNRADFAMDFQTFGFELEIDRFVTHARCKLKPYWSKADQAKDTDQPRSVLNGRRVESVTIGSMPGRQIIVYDKRTEAIARHKPHWFEVWGVDRDDPDLEVWRVEVRAGKDHLKDAYNIRTLEDFENSIGDVIVNSLEKIRYLASRQTDSNISRQILHPLWEATQATAKRELLDLRSGLSPDQIRSIEREKAVDIYLKQVFGNAVGCAVAMGWDDDAIGEKLPTLMVEKLKAVFENDPEAFEKAISRTRKRLHFL